MKTQCPQCHELNKTMSDYCENCGANLTDSESRQFSKKSENAKFTGRVIEGSRGYFIEINDDEAEVSHRFTQKKVKQLADKTKLSRQWLADLIAEKTTKIRFDFNGKYGESSIEYDISTAAEKDEAARIDTERKKNTLIEEKKRAESLATESAKQDKLAGTIVRAKVELRENGMHRVEWIEPPVDEKILNQYRSAVGFFASKKHKTGTHTVAMRIPTATEKGTFSEFGILNFDAVAKFVS